jgi:coproporphyrinogen III oxidase-like Fe-S oxidoreductase
MHGLPNQSVGDALKDLTDALSFDPPHLSWYQLTIEPNTFYHHQPPTLPKEDVLYDIHEMGQTTIAKAKLHSYEVSAYAKLDHECAHNKNYWEFGDYLGIGAGAHSKITQADGSIRRHWQVKNPKDYQDPTKKCMANQTLLTPEDSIFEFMLNALRLTKGVPVTLFSERTGLPLSSIERTLIKAREKKLIVSDPASICATELGHRYLNDLVGMFLPNK